MFVLLSFILYLQDSNNCFFFRLWRNDVRRSSWKYQQRKDFNKHGDRKQNSKQYYMWNPVAIFVRKRTINNFSHLPNTKGVTSFSSSNINVRCLFAFVCFAFRDAVTLEYTTSVSYFRKLSVFAQIYTTSSSKRNTICCILLLKNKLSFCDTFSCEKRRTDKKKIK